MKLPEYYEYWMVASCPGALRLWLKTEDGKYFSPSRLEAHRFYRLYDAKVALRIIQPHDPYASVVHVRVTLKKRELTTKQLYRGGGILITSRKHE